MEKNLEYLKEFMENTFGAVCFYNCPKDGYVSYVDKDKSMETLLVIFPSFLDLNNPLIKTRIEEKCGANCYDDKQDFSSLTPLFGGAIITSFHYKNKTRIIYGNISGYPIIQEIVNYFAGQETIDAPIKSYNSFKLLTSLNNFVLDANKSVKQCVEDYLVASNRPLVKKETGFYTTPLFKGQEDIGEYIAETHNILNVFENELKEIKSLNDKLQLSVSQQFSNLSDQQKQEFVKKYFNAKYEKPQISKRDPEFDD